MTTYTLFEKLGYQLYLGLTERSMDRVEAQLASGRTVTADVHDQVFAVIVDSQEEVTQLAGFDGGNEVETIMCDGGTC